MKRLFPVLAFPVLIITLAAGCQPSSAPAGQKPAGDAGAPAAQPVGAQPPAAQPPATTGSVPPGTLPGQPAEAPVKPVPAVLPAVLATVNGETVQRWELETALKQAEASAGGPVPPDKRDAVVRDLLDELITYHMLAQEAQGRKIGVSEADVDAEMAAVRKSFPTEEAYQQALLIQGVTVDQFRQVTRRGMQARKIIDAEITAKVAIQDAEVDAFYTQNLDRFKQGDTVRVSHIYFAVPPDAPPAEKNQKRAAAQDTLKQLKAGADFAKLAREQSNDPPSAENGGELGFIEQGQLPADFEKIAFALKPGTMSDVVELATGLHIIRVHERRGPRTAPLTEVRENLKQFLLNEQRQARLDELIGQLKGKSRIQILV